MSRGRRSTHEDIEQYLKAVRSTFELSDDCKELVCKECGFVQRYQCDRRFTLPAIKRYKRYQHCRQCKLKRNKKERYHIVDLNSDELMYNAKNVNEVAFFLGISENAALIMIEEHLTLRIGNKRIVVMEG